MYPLQSLTSASPGRVIVFIQFTFLKSMSAFDEDMETYLHNHPQFFNHCDKGYDYYAREDDECLHYDRCLMLRGIPKVHSTNPVLQKNARHGI